MTRLRELFRYTLGAFLALGLYFVLGVGYLAWSQWDTSFEATPANTDPLGQADDRMREIKDYVRARLESISDFGEFGNVTTDTGRMLRGVARIFSQSAAPTVNGTTSASCLPEADVDGNSHCSGGELWHKTSTDTLYVAIDSGSDGDADSWQDIAPLGKATIFIPAAAMSPTVTSGTASLAQHETTSGRPDINYLAFDPSSDESAQFHFEMPGSWNRSVITAKFQWSANSTNTGATNWGIACLAVDDSGLIDTAYGTAKYVSDAFSGTVEDLATTSETSSITVGGTPSDGDLIFCRVTRDGNGSSGTDTFTGDAWLLGVTMRYTRDRYNDD